MLQFDEYSKELFMRLKGLVNKRDGIYNSTGYKWVLENKFICGNKRNAADAIKHFGVEVAEGQFLVYVDAMTQWASYGSRGQVPVRYGFVMDDYGVVSFWKIGNKGNMRDGASPDPSKTKVQWTRSPGADFEHLIPDPKVEEERKEREFNKIMGAHEGNHLGESGKRTDFGKVTLEVSKYMGNFDVSYYETTDIYWNVYKTADGDVIYHNGVQSKIGVGEEATLVGTVKDHIVNKKNQRVTTISRPTLKYIALIAEMD